jgi:ketosteroid isomerase-like protein
MRQTIAHRLFEVIDGRQWERLGEVFAPDVVYERPGYEPFTGLERLGRFYRDERIIASGSHHLASVVVEEERAACWGRFLGTSRDGHPIDERFADFYDLSDGRIRRRTSFFFRPAV